MDERLNLFILVFIVFVSNVSGKSENLKLCVVGDPDLKSTRTTKYCDLLEKTKKSPVSCVYAVDRLECLLVVSRRLADFSVFEAEDLYFSTLWDEGSLLVVSEIRALKKSPFRHGVVVMVRKDSNIMGVGDLRGKRLCHPGFENGPEWNQLFAEYFEERVAPASCDVDLSLREDRIKTSSQFFGSACKAGQWSVNPEEDALLKRKYWNLCSLCDGGDCGNTNKYYGSGGAITCFKDGVGDILWARYEDIKAHFQFLEGNSEGNSYYLCENGTLLALTTENPCFWLAQPWQVVVANRKSALRVQKIMNNLSDEDRSDWEENFLHIIELYMEYVQNLLVSRTVEDYLRQIPGYLSASAMAQSNCKPKHSVNWCVTSANEKQKCEWIAKAGSSIGIQPSLECVEKSDIIDCLHSVKKEKTDVVTVAPDFFYDAVVIHNLRPFLLETGSQFKDNYLASIILKKNSEIKKLSDLKGKKICLTRKNGIGWWTLLSALHKEHLIGSYCDDLSDFFSKVCLAKDDSEGAFRCCSEDNFDSDETDVLHCLHIGGCDAAVLDFNTLIQVPDYKGIQSFSNFRVLCESDETTNNTCHRMWSYNNYLMTHAEPNSKKAMEIYSVFFQLGEYFGRNSRKSNSMLKIFEAFQGVKNVLFKDISTSFIPSDKWNQSNSYLNSLEKIKHCSKAPQQRISWLSVLIPFAASFYVVKQHVAC